MEEEVHRSEVALLVVLMAVSLHYVAAGVTTICGIH